MTRNKTSLALIFVLSLVAISPCLAISIEDQQDPKYCIVDTGQEKCYNNREIREPSRDGPFYGQDAQNKGNKPSYRDNGDGTVTDLNTGLMWVRERGKKVTWKDAISGAPACRIGGYTDWRMPTIKELYSLINFTGRQARTESESVPYIDTKYFGFKYGSGTGNERLIDCQDWSATEYLSTTMNNDASVFGVNFADGRIKGYPKQVRRREGAGDNRLYARYVRGNPEYGKNDFIDNGDGTVADRATGLVWSKGDSGTGMNWEQALKWVQKKNTENIWVMMTGGFPTQRNSRASSIIQGARTERTRLRLPQSLNARRSKMKRATGTTRSTGQAPPTWTIWVLFMFVLAGRWALWRCHQGLATTGVWMYTGPVPSAVTRRPATRLISQRAAARRAMLSG